MLGGNRWVACNTVRILLAGTVILFTAKTNAQENLTYIFINSAPGTSYTIKRPSTFTNKLFDSIILKINAPDNSRIKVGISCLFDYFLTEMDSVEKSLDNFMKLSQENKVPVLINLDGINWLQGRPDLWNWWDPKKEGYDPENKYNVEWTNWDASSAVKICWRNWGKQIRVTPAPNLASPTIIAAQIAALHRLVPRIIKWHHSLPQELKYLLGGVKVGHEASIGVNAYYYKNGNRYLEMMPESNLLDPMESYNVEAGISGGLTQLGFAAVTTAGIKKKGRITAVDLAQVVYHYLDTLCKTVYHLGLSKNLIFTHQGGTYAPWNQHLSFAAGSNEYSLPGWSFYATNPQHAGDLGDVLDRRTSAGWAAVEWWWPGANKNEWIYHLHQTLSFKDCRFLTIYNWENGLEKYREGMEAIREVVGNWR